MKDFLICLGFATSVFLSLYLLGAGLSSFVAWDISLFDVATWSEVGRGVLGIIGIFLGWIAFMFCIDEMTYKHKYHQAKSDLEAEEELRRIEMSVLRERNIYESSIGCRHFTL